MDIYNMDDIYTYMLNSTALYPLP